MGEQQTVRLEFVGGQRGTITYRGPTGREYRVANNDTERFIDVLHEDAVHLLQFPEFRLAPQLPPMPAIDESPSPIMFFLNTSDRVFVAWLSEYTQMAHKHGFRTEHGRIVLQQARPVFRSSGQQVIEMPSFYIVPDPDPEKNQEIAEPLPSTVTFRIVPLASERIEVHAECNQPAVQVYFHSLLHAVAQRWPEAQSIITAYSAAERSPQFLATLRVQTTDTQRKMLTAIWQHFCEHNQWMPVTLLHHKFGQRRSARPFLEDLKGSIVFERQEQNNTVSYELTILGVLLAEEGEHYEQRLIDYIAYVVERFAVDPLIREVTSQEVVAALNLTPEQSVLLYHLISMSGFWSGGWFAAPDWKAGIPVDIEDLLDADDLREYVRKRVIERYDPDVPVTRIPRDTYLRGKPYSSGREMASSKEEPVQVAPESLKSPLPHPRTRPEPLVVTLRFEPTKTGAKISWESFMGEFVSRFVLPYTTKQLPIVIKALDAAQHPDHPSYGPQFSTEEQALLTRLNLWKQGRVPNDVHQTVGRKLYDTLIKDRQGELALTSVRENARNQGKPLSYVLRFPKEAIELASLPWESLRDNRQALLLSRGGREIDSCQRYLNMNEALSPPLPIGQKLHILALSPQAGIPPEVRDEERAVRLKSWDALRAKGLLEYDELSPVTMIELDNRMRRGPQPDIIHYYGHGIYKDGSGYLLFDNPELPKQRERVSADRLSVQLGGIRLIMIHACQSAMIDDPENQGGLLTGIAPALSAVSEAVVAMQLTIRIRAAARFSEVFYEEIARGRSLQAAVAEARRSVYTIEEDGASWYVPTLYIRTREQNPVYLVQSEKVLRENDIKIPDHPYDAKPQPAALPPIRPVVDLPINEEIVVTAPVTRRVDDSGTSAISASPSVPHSLHTVPLLIGIVVDVSRSMMLTMRDIPKRAGLSHRAIQDAITDIRNEVVALCRSEQSQEVLPHVSLFLYGMGLSKTRHVVFDRFLRDAGLYSGAPVDASPVRDLCQDAADKAGLSLTPTASDLDLYWEEYQRSMEAHLGDILLGGPSVLYQGLSVARDRLRHELQSGLFKHALLLVLSDGQLKDGSDTDLLTVSQEIRRLGVDIFAGYIGKRSITRPYTLYGQPGTDWPDEAKRLFACSSPLSHENALISTMQRVMQERNWKIQEEARLFVHITQQKMLRDVVHLLKNSIQLSL
jgi:CHAT domain